MTSITLQGPRRENDEKNQNFPDTFSATEVEHEKFFRGRFPAVCSFDKFHDTDNSASYRVSVCFLIVHQFVAV